MTNEAGETSCLFTPTPKQLEFLQRPEPNVLFWGSRGTGKSLCGRWMCHLYAILYPNFHYIILRRTFPELQKSHLVHIDQEMRTLGGTFHHTNRVAHYPNGSKGFFSHCQSEEDVLNLLSAEFALAVFDELSTFDWEMFLKLAASVRVPKGAPYMAMVRGLTNPLGQSTAQIVKYFVAKEVDPEEDPEYNANDWFSVHATLDDNPYLDLSQYKKRFAGLPEHVKKAWLYGEYSEEDALFSFYPTKDGRPYHVIPAINIDELVTKARIFRVYDHGFSPDPAYCAWIAHLGNRYIAFHEKLWFKTIVSDIAADIKEIDKELGIEHVVACFCDPTIDIHTGADVRTIKGLFEQHGVPMDCSINNREQFASAVHTALAEEVTIGTDDKPIIVPRLQIVAGYKGVGGGCPYLIKAIPLQKYNPKKPEAMADNKHDHPVVSIAYFLISHASGEHREVVHKKLPKWMRHTEENPWVLGQGNVRTKF